MKYIDINGLEKPMSKIVYGTTKLAGNKDENFDILDKMYKLGITGYDTAAVYPNDGESILFNWAHDRGIRDKICILSKCSHPNAFRKRVARFDILSDIEDALAKPYADYIDVYMLHRDDESKDVGEIIDAFNELKNQGKIKIFGASNWTYTRIEEANEYAYKKNLTPFVCTSPQYSLVEMIKNPWADGCVSICGDSKMDARKYYAEKQMPIFCYSSLASGFLSGAFKYNEVEKAKNILHRDTIISYLHDCNIEKLRRIEILAEKKSKSVPKIALAWLFNQDLNIIALVSTMTESKMQDNLEALNIELSKSEIEWLNLEIDNIERR